MYIYIYIIFRVCMHALAPRVFIPVVCPHVDMSVSMGLWKSRRPAPRRARKKTKKQTTDNIQQTTDNRQTTHNKQQTNKQQTTNDKQTADSRQQTTDNRQ